MTDKQVLRNFVAGAYLEPANGGYADLIDPATGEVFATAPVSGPSDVDQAMARRRRRSRAGGTRRRRSGSGPCCASPTRSRRAPTSCSTPSVATRVSPRPHASEELPPMVDQIRFFAGAARVLEGRSAGEYMSGHTSYVRREPIGVCAQVTPWNYPMMMAVWKFAPALAAGNTVVLKPSDTTPVSTLLLAEIAAEFLPPGVLNVVCGDRDTGRHLIAHPTPRLVSITGSTRAGREVAGSAAIDLKRTHLELGGKAPVVVFDDADVESAAQAIAMAGYFNAGQDCTAATRVLAGPRIHDDFVAALTEQARATRTGGPEDPDAAYGPLNSANQLTRVGGFIGRLPDHASLRTGGERVGARGFFYAPTVVDGLRQQDEIIRTRSSARSSRCSGLPTRPGRGLGQRRGVRSGLLGVDPRPWPRHAGLPAPRLRLCLGQHPHPAGRGDAARRLQAVRLRQGPFHVRPGGLHQDQARDALHRGR